MIQYTTDDIFNCVRKYLGHQQQLYGSDLYLNNVGVCRKNPAESKSFNLEMLRKRIHNCTQCALSETRNHFVFGCGNPNAHVMLIGEAPGRDEDLQGEPFVGKAGQLLDKILAAIGFQRDEVYICNILKCRPPENRDPHPEEIVLCMNFLLDQIKIIQPKIILTLGRIAAQTLLNSTRSILSLRDTIHTFKNIPLIVTYHPAALLRNEKWKRPTWEDVQKLRTFYDQIIGDKPEWKPVGRK